MENGIMSFWASVEPDFERFFNEWYDKEHVPERVAVPGFLNGARYRSLLNPLRYLAFYETESMDVLSSKPYLERLNDPTPWTSKVMRQVKNPVRSVFRVRKRAGQGRGGFLATVNCAPTEGRDVELEEAIGSAIETMPTLPGIIGAHLWQSDEVLSTTKTAEQSLRRDEGAVHNWVIAIEGSDSGSVQAAYEDYFSAKALQSAGAADDVTVDMFQLLHFLWP